MLRKKLAFTEMEIELLYFHGCPSWQKALENLQAALRQLNLEAEIHLLKIESDEQAQQERFLGSPSFRINGQDLWPEERQGYALGCRVYLVEAGEPGQRRLLGYPSAAMLAEKISRFQA